MKLRTSLQLSAVFPILFAIVMTAILGWTLRSESNAVGTTFIVLTGVLGLGMAAVILFYSRDILRKIRILNEWTNAVLNGDLDKDVDIEASNDEVGRLSQALKRMLREIRAAYSVLEQESAHHKHLAEEHQKRAQASQIGAKHISDALTRFKQAHQETLDQERLQALEQIVRGVVHDFSEALVPILGIAEFMGSHPDILENRETTLEHMRTIRDSVERARESIKHLAGVFGKARKPDRPVDVTHAAMTAVDYIKSHRKELCDTKGIQIGLQTDFRMIPPVAGEEQALHDMIVNLMLNAIDAMPQGGTLSLCTRAEGEQVVIAVSDTGKGMTDEVRRRCTEPFYSTKTGNGHGMGLTIVAGTVKQHRGSIDVQSEPGKGTRISIRLPVWQAQTSGQTSAQIKPEPAQNLSVIIVDDDSWCLKTVSRSLSDQGHSVETVVNGEDCVSKLKIRKFDAAIIDRSLPGMSGDALATTIKSMSPKTAVIMLTGFGEVMLDEGDVPENVDVVVPKPARLEDLQRALARKNTANARPEDESGSL